LKQQVLIFSTVKNSIKRTIRKAICGALRVGHTQWYQYEWALRQFKSRTIITKQITLTKVA